MWGKLGGLSTPRGRPDLDVLQKCLKPRSRIFEIRDELWIRGVGRGSPRHCESARLRGIRRASSGGTALRMVGRVSRYRFSARCQRAAPELGRARSACPGAGQALPGAFGAPRGMLRCGDVADARAPANMKPTITCTHLQKLS
jgi:hypothetical protein